ncbi:low molecular weight protein-tyrosine-phosphatase [Sphingomonas crocodyli]|uniref:protein-tyrosine-phosphatase n=1 Tax=Sphingomonas crocodyli TaxID=1979270 RepID=A0A437LV94_9SPHN|nr:low molecular weight protein-tyrosine-phosphatase [Sphingomonas crocodyli]RVT89365.1 low molecular weight phosphotyrosine protein phosphatase [Sphingomonas crocodyli]
MSRSAVLFVCLGNICRSPLAEAAFRARAEAAGLDVTIDSAGTGDWHVGRPPDRRAQAIARANGIDISGYRGRQVAPDDFRRFSHIFALDAQNLTDLARVAPADGTAQVSLLLDLVPGMEGESVADPYFGDDDGFEVTWDEVDRAAKALLDRLAD